MDKSFWYQSKARMRVRDITGPPPLYSTLILGVFSLDQIADVGFNPSKYQGLSSAAEVFQPMWSLYLYVTDRWTDRRTDIQTDGRHVA